MSAKPWERAVNETDKLIGFFPRHHYTEFMGIVRRACEEHAAAETKRADEAEAMLQVAEGEARVLIGCPCRCHDGSTFRDPHLDCRECVRGSATFGYWYVPSQIDADHEWALWREKWTATLDTYSSLLERERARVEELEAALRELVWVIDKAGLLNLSTGVQLGNTSWYVKASERLEHAKTLLSPEPKAEPPVGDLIRQAAMSSDIDEMNRAQPAKEEPKAEKALPLGHEYLPCEEALDWCTKGCHYPGCHQPKNAHYSKPAPPRRPRVGGPGIAPAARPDVAKLAKELVQHRKR